MYVSAIKPTCPFIDDVNYRSHVADPVIDGVQMSRGLMQRDYAVDPFEGFAAPFDLKTIPRSEWRGIIEQQEREKSTIRHIAEGSGVKVKNQAQTNYCWINSPAWCDEVVRCIQGQDYVPLSPASVGAPIKGYRNQGGWGTEGLKYIAEHGIAPVEDWPANAIDRQYDNEKSRASRLKYKITEWYDLKPRNIEQVATCLLLRIPVAVGLNWWGHEVTLVGVKALANGQFGFEFANSWGTSYGDNGYGVLSESKATPDDAVAPRVAMAA